MTELLITVAMGAGIGATMGWYGRCSTGSCPLTANWKRGALYGATLGLAFHLVFGQELGTYRHPKNIPTVTEAAFDAEVAGAGKPVVVDFYAPWCGPCKVLAPRLDALAGEFGDRIKFISVNYDDSPAVTGRFQVQGVPTLLFIDRDGRVVDMILGMADESTLRAKLQSLAGS
jgi:thioredoxin 1